MKKTDRRCHGVRAMMLGLVVATAVFGTFLLVGGRTEPALFGGFVAGVVSGTIWFRSAESLRAQNDRVRLDLGFELTPPVRRDALKGSPAVDPADRQRQLAVVHYLLGRVRADRVRNTFVFVLLGGLQVGQALSNSSWFWLGAVFFGLMALLAPWEITRLRRRRAELASAP